MLFYLALIIGVIVLDQLSKLWAVAYLQPLATLPLIPGVLHFTYSENSGAAFSILRDKQSLLVGVTFVAMIAMSIYLYKWAQEDGERWHKLCLAAIIGGGIGNLIDRIRLAYVVDFIDFRLINFAIFNVADSFISVGSVGLLLLLLLKKN